MSINELKNLIHNQIDKSDNQTLLEFIHNFFAFSEFSEDNSVENIWYSFSEKQRENILLAFNQSEDDSNLLSHDTVMIRIKGEL